MQLVDPWILVACMRRVSELLKQRRSLEVALKQTADELTIFYKAHIGEKVVEFKLPHKDKKN